MKKIILLIVLFFSLIAGAFFYNKWFNRLTIEVTNNSNSDVTVDLLCNMNFKDKYHFEKKANDSVILFPRCEGSIEIKVSPHSKIYTCIKYTPSGKHLIEIRISHEERLEIILDKKKTCFEL